MHTDNTIVAISTPPGRGGIGVVRLSGAEAVSIAKQLVRLPSVRGTTVREWPGCCAPPKATPGVRARPPADPGRARPPALQARLPTERVPPSTVETPADSATPETPALEPWRARLGELLDASGEAVDQVVVTWFAKPRSYTGEDVVEISCHGAPVVLRLAVERALALGARLAEPGEFTMRAFLNGRMDLAQAEAVRDLIEARTLYQAKVAAQQVGGAVSRQLAPVKKRLVDLIALLEAGIDFAEDDVSVAGFDEIRERIGAIEADLGGFAATFEFGRIVHDGLTLAIVGRPNVGKSSLFNRLAERERAIVTAAPGTTRDLVTETIHFEGIPVRLVDTAGIREARDEAESIGIRKSYEALADSDLTLVVLDASAGTAPLPADQDLIAHAREQGKALVVWNKIDLLSGDVLCAPSVESTVKSEPQLEGSVPSEPRPERSGVFADGERERFRPAPGAGGGEAVLTQGNRSLSTAGPDANPASRPAVSGRGSDGTAEFRVSALTGQGIAELRHAIVEAALPGLGGHRESAFLTNIRQERLLLESVEALQSARRAAEQEVPHEMLLLDLYSALNPLDAITGQTTVDDILNQIFSTFCIGK